MKPGDLVMLAPDITKDFLFMEVTNPRHFETAIDSKETIRFWKEDVGLVVGEPISLQIGRELETWIPLLVSEGLGYLLEAEKMFKIIQKKEHT